MCGRSCWKTILTYLELDGFLEQGTPFYAGYSLRPASGGWDDVYAAFDPDRADFLRRVLASGKEGRIWTGVDPDAVPGEERDRVIKALDYLEQRGLVEVKVADVRQRFTLREQPPSLDGLRDRLAERFDRREQSEAEREISESSPSSSTMAARCRRSSATSARPAPIRAGTVRIA